MAQKQYSRSIARLVLVAGMCFTAIGLCSVSASAIDNTELLQPVAIKEDSLQPIGQSVLLADVTEENWYEGTSGSLYYCYADGTYATGITTLPNEETYLFALDGTLKTGWQTIDGVRYYFDLTTGQKQFGWISHSNRLYYVFPETGKQVGEAVIDGTPYVFDEFGVLQTGIYTCEDGTIAGCAEDATPYTGFVTDETSHATYYFNENGIAQTGWQTVDGATYYLGEDGVLRTGLTSIDDSVYDFGTDGAMQTGLVTMEDGTVLFFGADGKQAMGLQTVDGKTYYFNDLGMAVNTKQTIDGKTYYFGADGSMQTGLVTLNNGVYYFGADGSMQTGKVTLKDGSYYFGENGEQVTGWLVLDGSEYYFDLTTGKMATGTVTLPDGTYIFDENGVLQKKQSGISYAVPYYNQADPRWGSTYIGTKTIAQVGCLVTSLAMTQSYHTDTEILPDEMRYQMQFDNNSILWAPIIALGYELEGCSGLSTYAFCQRLYTLLEEHGPVIVGSDNVYGGSHYVVVTGCTNTDTSTLKTSDFTMNDPGFSNRTTLDEHLAAYPTWFRFFYMNQ
jgi:glucan-binding repeat-containing protein